MSLGRLDANGGTDRADFVPSDNINRLEQRRCTGLAWRVCVCPARHTRVSLIARARATWNLERRVNGTFVLPQQRRFPNRLLAQNDCHRYQSFNRFIVPFYRSRVRRCRALGNRERGIMATPRNITRNTFRWVWTRPSRPLLNIICDTNTVVARGRPLGSAHRALRQIQVATKEPNTHTGRLLLMEWNMRRGVELERDVNGTCR